MYSKGLVRSPEDKRDYILKAIVKAPSSPPPEECLEWLKWVTPVKFQAELGSCAAFAGNGAVEVFNTKELSQPLDFSEQFLYGQAKEIDGRPDEDGTYLRAILSVLKHIGVCEEAYQPYEGIYPPKNSPAPGAIENASKYKIKSYALVDMDKESIKIAISQTGPIIAGIMVDDNFETIDSTGIAPMPEKITNQGHAIVIVGYNKLGLIVKNSWSYLWGDKGYCYIPWNVWEAIATGEVWSIVDITGVSVSSTLNWFLSFIKGLLRIA
jgi:C1A family cysteine protease